MRIWDIPVAELCRAHLLGEHRELHAIWSILTQDRRGYRNHPEVKRWLDYLPALEVRHFQQVREIRRRGWKHRSDLLGEPGGCFIPPPPITPIDEQRAHLLAKACGCCKED